MMEYRWDADVDHVDKNVLFLEPDKTIDSAEIQLCLDAHLTYSWSKKADTKRREFRYLMVVLLKGNVKE